MLRLARGLNLKDTVPGKVMVISNDQVESTIESQGIKTAKVFYLRGRI